MGTKSASLPPYNRLAGAPPHPQHLVWLLTCGAAAVTFFFCNAWRMYKSPCENTTNPAERCLPTPRTMLQLSGAAAAQTNTIKKPCIGASVALVCQGGMSPQSCADVQAGTHMVDCCFPAWPDSKPAGSQHHHVTAAASQLACCTQPYHHFDMA